MPTLSQPQGFQWKIPHLRTPTVRMCGWTRSLIRLPVFRCLCVESFDETIWNMLWILGYKCLRMLNKDVYHIFSTYFIWHTVVCYICYIININMLKIVYIHHIFYTFHIFILISTLLGCFLDADHNHPPVDFNWNMFMKKKSYEG